jgi:hypothetical protein
VLWCLASRDLFAPALARAGLHPDRVFYAETWRHAEVLPVREEGVRFPGLAGVVGEIGRLSLSARAGFSLRRKGWALAGLSGARRRPLSPPRHSSSLLGTREPRSTPAGGPPRGR